MSLFERESQMKFRMPQIRSIVLAIACFIVAMSSNLRAANDADSDAVKLQLEVNALTSLNDLNLTSDQLSALKGMISDTAGTISDTPTPVNADCKAALKAARTALLSKDQNKIDSTQDKLGDLEQKQDPDSDPDVDQSDAAKEKAPALLKLLSVKQVANYISQNADGVDDPSQLLLDAVHHARGSSDDDFESLREDTSEQIGIFFGIAHAGKPLQIVGKVNRFLTKVHHLSADDYKSQQAALEDEAKQLVGALDPIPCLRHWMDNEMADLLSNPQLSQAIDDLGVK